MGYQQRLNDPTADAAEKQRYQQLADQIVQETEAARVDTNRENAMVDPEFASPACDCEPGEPCCLKAFELQDKKAPARKVVWPIQEGAPKRLYMVTKDPYEGAPSAEVKAVLTDFEECKCGVSSRPGLEFSGFVTGNGSVKPRNEEIMVVTTPVGLQGPLSALFPSEFLLSIYAAGYYLAASTYRGSPLPDVSPDVCALGQSEGLEVHAVPHLALKGNVSGKVWVEFFLSGSPTFGRALTGSIEGEMGNQSLSYTASSTGTISTPREQEGPTQNAILDSLATLYEKMRGISEVSGNNPVMVRPGVTRPTRSSIKIELGCSLDIADIKLQGDPGSPNLALAAKPFTFSVTLGVLGTVDLVDAILSYPPLRVIGDSLREARAALAKEGQVVQIVLDFSLKLGAEGTLLVGMQNDTSVKIGPEEWEANFKDISMRYSGKGKVTGKLELIASVGVNTWFFDGTAGVEGSVSTGWHFGSRTTEQSGGVMKHEKLYWFEGLRVKGRFYVRTGSPTSISGNSDTFTTPGTDGSDPTRVSVSDSIKANNETVLVDVSVDESFWAPEGGENNWQEV